MLYPSMSCLLGKINSRYLLVNAIANRSRKIAIEADEMGIILDKKSVSMAIDEIANGTYTVKVRTELI